MTSSSDQNGSLDELLILVIADHDDPDAERIVSELETREISTKWIRLGLHHKSYDLRFNHLEATLKVDGETFSTAELRGASSVFHRRWRVSPPSPPVRFDDDVPGAQFAEREWQVAISDVLNAWSGSNAHGVWANRPGTLAGRAAAYLFAREAEFNVPNFSVGTSEIDLGEKVVAKSVSTNEHIESDHYFPTLELSRSSVASLRQEVSPCPNLVQVRVDAVIELRIVYCLGETGAVALTRESGEGPVDIRFASEVQASRHLLSKQLTSQVMNLAAISGFNFFTLDLLIDEDDRAWFVDMNPEGTIQSLDDESETLLSTTLAGLMKESA